MPKEVAKPRPAPPIPAKPAAAVFSHKEQEHFTDEAIKLAAELGFSGDADNILRFVDEQTGSGIRVEDAQNYLRKILHELHQAALTPGRSAPTADQVCEHLAVTDADEIAHVAATLEAAFKREVAEAPANPAEVARAPKLANIEANIDISGGASA